MKHAAKPTVLYHREDATKTRRDILSVATDVASAEGLEGLSIGRLANELGLSKTGIFAHFGSKQLLQLATVDSARQIFLERVIQPALEHDRGIRRLRAMLENVLAYVEQSVFLRRMLLRGGLGGVRQPAGSGQGPNCQIDEELAGWFAGRDRDRGIQ